MEFKQNKNKYIEDEEFLLNIEYLKKYGIELNNQLIGPYIETRKVLEVDENTTVCVIDTLGRLEFTVFYKKNYDITITNYTYTGYDYDRSKTPKIITRHTHFVDSNKEFDNYYKSTNKNMEEFLLNNDHIKYINTTNLNSTFVVLVPGYETKYAVIKGTIKDYLDTLIVGLLDEDKSAYENIGRPSVHSLIAMSNYVLRTLADIDREEVKHLNLSRFKIYSD